MKSEGFTSKRLIDTIYKNKIKKLDEAMIYCEIEYQRDRSSFAGVALKVNNKHDIFEYKRCKEKKEKDISKYEKLFIGSDQDYINSLKAVFNDEHREYGIEVYFLVYSDLRSSQAIFEELMVNIDKNIESLKAYF